jgi:putative heme-binding domain-containing protein
MPRVGSSRVDERATQLIHDWIAKMAQDGAATRDPVALLPAEGRSAYEALLNGDRLQPAARATAVARLASSTRGALMLLGLLDGGSTRESLRRDVVALARSSPQVEVRDLFERFIPEDQRVKRLGDAVDRAAILALAGDAGRGRAVFTDNPAAQCKTCHKAGAVGETLGPDLTKIGAKHSKAVLLDQILEPSKTIDPPYVTHLLETKDGRIITGLLVEKSKEAVVLKDAQAKTVRIPNAEVESLAPQSRSLMPELLLRDLTAQQVADLIEFLANLR